MGVCLLFGFEFIGRRVDWRGDIPGGLVHQETYQEKSQPIGDFLTTVS